jgi:Domain of unknown function (DUF4439)
VGISPAVCSRRSFLTVGAGLMVAGVCGCSGPAPPSAPAAIPADDLAVARAVDQARLLRADATSLLAAQPAPRLSVTLRAIQADHAAHLAALGAPGTLTSAPSATTPSAPAPPTVPPSTAPPLATPPPATVTPPVTPPATLSAGRQIKTEWVAAREALRDAATADAPGLAVLLARIAAARAVHADLITAAAGRDALPELAAAPPLSPLGPSASATTSSSPTAASKGTASDHDTVLAEIGVTSAILPLPTTAPGSTAPGSTAPGSTAPGSTAPGSTAPGSTAPGSTAPGPADASTAIPATSPASAPDTAWLKSLDRMLAGQHAAVFAYPLIIAQLTGTGRAQALRVWQVHQAFRNELTQVLVAADRQPSAAAPAYDIGARPVGLAAARRLAGSIELGLTALASDAVAASNGSKERAYASAAVVAAVRCAARWTGAPVPLRAPEATTPTTPATR